MTDTIERIPDIQLIIDKLEHFEAQRALTRATSKDIDAYLYMYNTVFALAGLRDKINEIIDVINKGEQQWDFSAV